MVIQVGKCYREFSYYTWHYYYVADDRVIHINVSAYLINAFTFENTYTAGLNRKFTKDDALPNIIHTKDFFHSPTLVQECSLQEFQIELINVMNKLKILQLFDPKKLFDYSRSRTEIKTLYDLF